MKCRVLWESLSAWELSWEIVQMVMGELGIWILYRLTFRVEPKKPYLRMCITFITGSATYLRLANTKTSNKSTVSWRPMEALERIQGQRWEKMEVEEMWKESWEWNSKSSMTWQCLLGRLSPDTMYIDCARLSHFQTNNFTGRVSAQ